MKGLKKRKNAKKCEHNFWIRMPRGNEKEPVCTQCGESGPFEFSLATGKILKSKIFKETTPEVRGWKSRYYLAVI